MADADEDVIPQMGPSTEDIDLSDETQDFRFLASMSGEAGKIPKRGEKDFEPHATALQSNTLAASRTAMTLALSHPRLHPPKTHSQATYHPYTNMAYTYNPKGPLFVKMGRILPATEDPLGNDALRGQRMWLRPEEALFLVDRGTLEVVWPAEEGGQEGVETDPLPMSLQGAYAMFIGADHELTFERYSVYAALKRGGYVVVRAPSWSDVAGGPDERFYPSAVDERRGLWEVGFGGLWKAMMRTRQRDRSDENRGPGPLLKPGLYRDYSEIYRRLALIDWHDPTKVSKPDATMHQTATDPDFRVTWHVWKPSTNYRKSDPSPPDFRIAVVNGRETLVPTLQQLDALMGTVPYDPPKPDGQLYQKLRQGYRNVVLAVVDQGVVSYLRIADAAFGCEKLYERTGRPMGGKRGGRGGRGGRGRGRGRGG